VLEAGRTAVLVPADLTHENACRALVDRAVQEFGRIDILVNNAAHQMAQPGGIADITTKQFDRVLKANLYAMFWFCKMALPHMHAGASTINTSSVQPSSPSPELLGVGQHGETPSRMTVVAVPTNCTLNMLTPYSIRLGSHPRGLADALLRW